jgi:hypothetical protein
VTTRHPGGYNPNYDAEAALAASSPDASADVLLRELANIRHYVIAEIPPGADPTNDYWRKRVLQLQERIARMQLPNFSP